MMVADFVHFLDAHHGPHTQRSLISQSQRSAASCSESGPSFFLHHVEQLFIHESTFNNILETLSTRVSQQLSELGAPNSLGEPPSLEGQMSGSCILSPSTPKGTRKVLHKVLVWVLGELDQGLEDLQGKRLARSNLSGNRPAGSAGEGPIGLAVGIHEH